MSETLSAALEACWTADRVINFYDLEGKFETLTFAQFGAAVQEAGDRLTRASIGPGHVVAVMGATSPQLTQMCAAIWSVGATLTVIPTPTRLGNLEQFLVETLGKLSQSQASLLLGDEDAVGVFAELSGIPTFSWDQFAQLEEPVRAKKADFQGAQAALVQFSSGTTRDPQPILLSETALLENSRAVLSCLPGEDGDHSCVSWLPLYHDMGLIGCFLMPILATGNLTLMGPETFVVRPLTWLEAISQEKATTSSAPNFALSYCTERILVQDMRALDLSSWQISMVGAETVRPETLRNFAGKFSVAGFREEAFSPVYGLAEATLAVTFSPLGKGLKTLRFDARELATSGLVLGGTEETPSLGFPLPGVKVEIRKDGKTLPEGRLGEVWVRSPSLLSQVGDDGPIVDGWLETGDAGFMVAGELYLYGRRRDILLLEGRNHDPSTLEGAAEGIEHLRRCCAFTNEVQESERDELVLLCEVASSWDGDPSELVDTIRTHCRKSTTLICQQIVLLKSGELPVTTSGKLRRGAAAQMFAAQEMALFPVLHRR